MGCGYLAGLEVDVRVKDSGDEPCLRRLQRIRLLQRQWVQGPRRGGAGVIIQRSGPGVFAWALQPVTRQARWRAYKNAPGRREEPESSRPQRGCPRGLEGTQSTCTGCRAQ